MKFLMIAFAICTSIALVAGQNFLFGRFPNRQFDYNSIDVPQSQDYSARDPRQNRGPVVFPPSPPDAIDESSGVIVGASGYGFVPPQQNTDTDTATNTITNANTVNTALTGNKDPMVFAPIDAPPPPKSRVGSSYFTTTALRAPGATSYAAFNYYNFPYFQRLNFV